MQYDFLRCSLLFWALRMKNGLTSLRTWQHIPMVAPYEIPGRWPGLSSPPMAVISITKANCTGSCTREAHSHGTCWEISAFQSPSAGSGRKEILIREVRIPSDSRKNFPKLLHRSLGNRSVTQWHNWIETRRLFHSCKKKCIFFFFLYLLTAPSASASWQAREETSQEKEGLFLESRAQQDCITQ